MEPPEELGRIRAAQSHTLSPQNLSLASSLARQSPSHLLGHGWGESCPAEGLPHSPGSRLTLPGPSGAALLPLALSQPTKERLTAARKGPLFPRIKAILVVTARHTVLLLSLLEVAHHQSAAGFRKRMLCHLRRCWKCHGAPPPPTPLEWAGCVRPGQAPRLLLCPKAGLEKTLSPQGHGRKGIVERGEPAWVARYLPALLLLHHQPLSVSFHPFLPPVPKNFVGSQKLHVLLCLRRHSPAIGVAKSLSRSPGSLPAPAPANPRQKKAGAVVGCAVELRDLGCWHLQGGHSPLPVPGPGSELARPHVLTVGGASPACQCLGNGAARGRVASLLV